jgi:hypothetical protein
MEDFKYLGKILRNPSSICEEIKSRLKSENACYHSVQNILSYSLLSKNITFKIYRTKILPVVFWVLNLISRTEEENRLRTLENGALRKFVGSNRRELTAGLRSLNNGEHYGFYSVTNILCFNGLKKTQLDAPVVYIYCSCW